MTLYKWSQTAAADATADSTINWAEGQSPSSVNDSARAMMAATAKYRDDCNGTIVTTGTASAYVIASNQVFDTLAHMQMQELTFGAHATNAAGATLNVDSLGAKPINTADGVAITAGTIIQGGVYTVTYFPNGGGEFILHNVQGNPYNIPLGGLMPYIGGTPPNSSFVFPFGQAISRTTYATLFSLVGTSYGAGDGSTTFGLPDFRGRVLAGKDDMGGSAANRITNAGSGIVGTTLGASGGSETQTLTAAQIPAHQHAVFLKDPQHTHTGTAPILNSLSSGGGVGAYGVGSTAITINSATTGITIGSVNGTANDNQTAQTGGGGAHPIMPPTAICNYILRII
jgi:microcystin-dependent protein